MRISLIVAAAENGVIGREGRLPWRLSADLRRFQQLTMGHHLVMGRKTFESIGRPLPGRTSIVLSRRRDFQAAGVRVASGLDEALQLAAGDDEVFIVGGAEVYGQALPRAGRIHLTRVHADIAGDARFPQLPPGQWSLRESCRHSADTKNQYDYSFLLYERIPMSHATHQELIDRTRQLLDCIARADWETYRTLCAPTLTAFEPEACGQLVEGLDFHRYYFDLGPRKTPAHTTLCAPHVRMLGDDAAVVSYVRLIQVVDPAGASQTLRFAETRVWQRQQGQWIHVHFHRS